MITGKQRSYLKSLANGLDTTVYIGKNGLTDEVIQGMETYIAKHEMVKVKIQEGAILDPKETANIAAEKLGAEFVQAIGRKFVLYRQSADEPIIVLP